MKIKILNNNKYLPYYLLFVISIFCFKTSIAQKALIGDDFFYTFELPNGTSGNFVQDIYQDKDGIMWFATLGGLTRFDGSNFKTYRHEADKNSLSSTYVECIYEANDGTLWLGTWGGGGGLNKFDKKTETFTRFKPSKKNRNSLSSSHISDIVEDHEGYIWVATERGLNKLDPKTGAIKHYFHDENDPKSLSNNFIRTLFVDSQGVLWIGTGYPWHTDKSGGLNRYHPETDNFTSYTHDLNNPKSISNNKVTAIFEDSDHNFWVGTAENKVHLFDRKSSEFRLLDNLSSFKNTEYYKNIRSFTEDDEGHLWICSYGSGIKVYDKANDRTLDYYYQEVYEQHYGKQVNPLNFSWLLYQTNDGTKWICSGGEGKAVLKTKKTFPYLNIGYYGDPTLSIYQNNNGNIWMGRKWNQLCRINPNEHRDWWFHENGTKTPGKAAWANTFNNNNIFFINNIHLIYEDEDSILWASKKDEGLIRCDLKNEQLQHFKHLPTDKNSISGNTLVDISPGIDENDLWVLTNNGILNKMDKKSSIFKEYSAKKYDNFPKNPSKLLMTNNTLWIGSIQQQKELIISRLNTNNDQFLSISIHSNPYSDSTFQIINIAENSLGEIWIGTDRSLSKINPKTDSVTHFPFEIYQLNDVKSMLIDDNDHIWLATESGISVFDPLMTTMFTFPPKFDIQGTPFSFRSAFKNNKGELFFGGYSGCLYIDKLSQQTYHSLRQKTKQLSADKIVISDFSINGQQATEEKTLDHIISSQQLALKHNENIFSFQLALLDFNIPELNRFEFFLENYDKNWRKAEKNTAYYAQVPPGKYNFRVRGYNFEGSWGEGQAIQITVLPPWWQRWWAYSLYVLFFTSIFYSIYRFQLGRKIAKEENHRLQELDAAKTQLYTNITHEFRTPITVILGIAEQLKNIGYSNQMNRLDMISRNGAQLLGLVNQMLDLSKLESKKMSLQLQQRDMIRFLKTLTQQFELLAQNQQIHLHFLTEIEQQNMDFDANKIQQIISNLVSNAIKFTPAKGHIYIIIKKIIEKEEKLHISIKDTGIGITEDRLPHIFKRFYQADNSDTKEYQGSGIGLALVYELTQLMGGQINVKSQIGQGSDFTVSLPIRQQAKLQTGKPSLTPIQSIQAIRPIHSPKGEVSPSFQSIDDKNTHPAILIVEDNPDLMAYIQSCLPEKYQILAAKNGQEGIDTALKHTPDLIITDIMMPQKDGYELCQTLKTNQCTSHIPIVMLTAKADMDSKLQGLEQGADAYLAKPFNTDELHIRIDKLLELRHKLKEHYLALINNEAIPKATPDHTLTDKSNLDDGFVLKVKSTVLENINDYELNVEKICKELGISHSQLHKKLTALTGLSTVRFIRHIRLNKAKELLQNQHTSVATVAYDTGFNDPAYFARVFKKETGITPKEWQQKG